MPKSIGSLKQDLLAVRAQRDQIQQTRNILRTKLEAAERRIDHLRSDHLKIWAEHVMPQYDEAIPPAGIVEHIAYRRNVETFSDAGLLRDGWLAAQQIKQLAEHATGSVNGFKSVLDFGCGCGRLTRYFPSLLAPGGILKGCDIDAAAIEWNQQNLAHSGTFFASPDHPPLPLPEAEQFDLIVVLSVFTHLPEGMQDHWMQELAARLQPGGIMVATFHGPYYERFIPEPLREEFFRTGFCYTDLGKTPDLPDYYLTAFHSHDYINSHWGKFAEVTRIEQQGVDFQDAAVLRKR